METQGHSGSAGSTGQTRRLLVTGANGMIGHALCAIAPDYGWTAVPAQRPLSGNPLQAAPAAPGTVLWEPGAVHPFGDMDALEGLGAVVHLSGANLAGHRWTPAYKKTIVDSRTQTTGALALALARLHTPPPVLLTASATGFYGSRGDEELTEQSARGQGFLSDVCERWEAAASPATAAGLRVIHLRFGVVLSPFGGALRQMLPLFRAGLGGVLGSGRQWMSWVALHDLLAAIFHCIEQPQLSGPVNVVAPTPVRNRDFTAALAKVLHRPAFLPAPAFALRTAFGSEMANETLLCSCKAVPECLHASGFSFRYPDVAKALGGMVALGAGLS